MFLQELSDVFVEFIKGCVGHLFFIKMKGKKTPLVISMGHLLKTPKPQPSGNLECLYCHIDVLTFFE